MKKKTFAIGGIIVGVVIVCIAVLVVLLCMLGTEGQFVRVTNTKGVTKGNSVIWRDTYVGKVTKIKSKDGQFEVWFELNPEYKKTIRSDAKACLTVLKSSSTPGILLVGGQDQSFPLFADGAEVQELQESSLTSAQISDKIAGLKDAGWEEIVVWIIIAVVCGFALKTKAFRNVVSRLVKGKRAAMGERGCRERSCCTEYIG